jgi:hypothetical protein
MNLEIMATTKLKLGLAAVFVAGGTIVLFIQHQSQLGVRDENRALRQQIARLQTDKDELSNHVTRARATRAPRPPTPPVQAAASANPALLEPIPIRNLYALITNRTSQVKLTPAQVEDYLNENRRSAASLLSAYRASDDPALLREAMEKYPDQPVVGFEAALRKDAPPAERRQWLDAFKQSAPENALADYLSAADHFKAGQADLAVQDLVAAAGKPQLQDYSLDRIQAAEEAFRAAGYPVADAKVLASSQLVQPHLPEVRGLAGNLLDLANSYQAAGDETSRQAALGMAVDLGQRYGDALPGEMLIAQLVGINIERIALGAMDPSATYGANGQTVQVQLDQLTQQRAGIKALATQADPLLQTLSDQEWISYEDRSATFGEAAAMRWLVGKHASN